MVPMKRVSSYEGRIDRAVRSFQRSRWPVVAQGVAVTTLAVGAGSMLVNVLSHVVGG